MRRILDDNTPHIYRFARQLTRNQHCAEDLTQEVLLRAWRKRRDLQDPSAARSWLLRITANAWKDELRKRRTQPAPARITDEEPLAQDVSPDKASMDREDVQRALAALDTLPPRQRNTVYLYVCEQLDLSEIAEVLTISYSAAKASLSAGRRQLRDKLKDMDLSHASANRQLD